MRKVTYKINDNEYLRNKWVSENKMGDEDFDKMFQDSKPFIATYILWGEHGQFPTYYKLLDKTGKKMYMSDLNGYQIAVLNDCVRHFNGVPCEDGGSDPFGVIQITEEEVLEIDMIIELKEDMV